MSSFSDRKFEADFTVAAKTAGSQRKHAYQELRRLLILCQIPEGARLREGEWAARVGVHRTALREAFARLEAEGLLVLGPKTGYFVPRMDEREIREIVEVRAALEVLATERICGKAGVDPAILQPLYEACDELERLVDRNYLLGAIEADRRFHEVLVAAAGSRRLEVMYARAPLPMLHRTMVPSADWAASAKQTVQEHRAICDAIRRGKMEEARRLLRHHLVGHVMPASTGQSA